MTLAYEGMCLEAEPGLTFTAYSPQPGSKSEDAMRLLASWAASEEPSVGHRLAFSPKADTG